MTKFDFMLIVLYNIIKLRINCVIIFLLHHPSKEETAMNDVMQFVLFALFFALGFGFGRSSKNK